MKKNHKYFNKATITIALIAIVILILFFAFSRLNIERYQRNLACPAPAGSTALHNNILTQTPHYTPKEFDLANRINGLSKEQLSDHKTLYERYVAKRNEIAQQLKTVSLDKQNKTYSPYRSLKIAETYALNGSILHELYFENMNKQPSTIGSQMLALINESFGSFELFKEDLLAAARCARGWVLTCYSIDDGLIHNYVLEEHNQTVPVLIIPLLVLDVYEHAYMIDFGINISLYLDIFWKNIDWNVVEERINKWVHKFRA